MLLECDRVRPVPHVGEHPPQLLQSETAQLTGHPTSAHGSLSLSAGHA